MISMLQSKGDYSNQLVQFCESIRLREKKREEIICLSEEVQIFGIFGILQRKQLDASAYQAQMDHRPLPLVKIDTIEAACQ